MDNYFNTLNTINVNGKTEQKNGLTYLSWAWAWAEVKKLYPDATYTIYENSNGWFYHTDGKTCWVKTGVTVNGIEHIEYLPVMDFKNKSIPLNAVTSFDVNKAIQRSLTKAVARHGLGLYIYAGEDLPEDSSDTTEAQKPDTGINYVAESANSEKPEWLVLWEKLKEEFTDEEKLKSTLKSCGCQRTKDINGLVYHMVRKALKDDRENAPA